MGKDGVWAGKTPLRAQFYLFLFYVRSVGSATDRKISRHLSIARDNKQASYVDDQRGPHSVLLGSPRRLQGVSLIVIFVRHRLAAMRCTQSKQVLHSSLMQHGYSSPLPLHCIALYRATTAVWMSVASS